MKNSILVLFSLFSLSVYAQVVEKTDMPGQRSGHSCTSLYNLNSGQNYADFLVCGGLNASSYLDSAYIFNYESNDWTAAESMNFPRYDHVALQLQDGRVLVTGGWNGIDANQNTTEIYNPEFGFWEEGPLMAVGRSGHTMTLLSDGKVLIVGGFDGFENTNVAELFNPIDNSITSVSSMNYGRTAHTATAIDSYRVLVTGGFNPDFGFQMNQCEIYNALLDTWTEVDAMSSGRDNHAALFTDGGILVSGGRVFNSSLNLFEGQTTTEIFDFFTETWSSSANLPSGQNYHAMYRLANKIIIVGGADQTGLDVTTTFSNSAEYDPTLDQWTEANYGDADGKYLFASDIEFVPLGFLTTVFACGGEGDPSSEVYMDFNSIEENQQQIVEVYPNPAIDFITIDSDHSLNQYSIEVFDAQGRQVLDWSVKSESSLDVSKLNTGIYYLALTQGEKRMVFKMMKE